MLCLWPPSLPVQEGWGARESLVRRRTLRLGQLHLGAHERLHQHGVVVAQPHRLRTTGMQASSEPNQACDWLRTHRLPAKSKVAGSILQACIAMCREIEGVGIPRHKQHLQLLV